MSLFGGFMAFLLMVWIMLTLYLFATVQDMYAFLRSMGFIGLSVGYIAILAVYFMFKEVFREDDEYY